MESSAKLNSSGKADKWKAKREEIGLLVSRGMEPSQIEEELQKEGSRVTAQVREYIVWEKRSPEVRELLAQGLEVAAVEDKMRQKGWVWTENLRKKAWWEFHREEIIKLYKNLRSVEAVREVMVKKGFTPQTRIYYEWLRCWGIPTSINRSTLSERGSCSHGSPLSSNTYATPASAVVSYHQMNESCEIFPSESSHPHLTHTVSRCHENLPQRPATHLGTVAAQDQEGPINVYQLGGGLMDINGESHNVGVLAEVSYPPIQIMELIPSSNYPTQVRKQSLANLNPLPCKEHSYFDDSDSDRSDDADIYLESDYTTTQQNSIPSPSGSVIAVVPWLNHQVEMNTSQGKQEQSDRLQRITLRQNDALASQPMSGANLAHRVSADSGYASKTSSIQSNRASDHHKSLPVSDPRERAIQKSNGRVWAFGNSLLHVIRCSVDHRGMGLKFDCCGSSVLQELAQFATEMSAQQVYERLCKYMQLDGALLCDGAGNTFLQKLAVAGAPWEYFKAAFAAGVDIRHQNAYGQTFAHVLDVSKFSHKLIECLSSLQALGFDFCLRDYSGRTILHCIYDQQISPQTALDILQFFNNPGRQLSLRDVSGRTPYEIFKQTYLREASQSPRWSTAEPQLQVLGRFEDIVNDGVLRFRDGACDAPSVSNNLVETLQSQYQKVVDNGKMGIAIEASDGSNAFHAQAALVTMVHEAADDFRSLERFIACGIDTNDYDIAGRTPLEATIIHSRNYETELTISEKVSLLIDSGKANVHSRNRLGHTPLFSAAVRGLDRTVEALLIRNSHINIRANNGQSLLDAVTDAGRRAFVEYRESGLSEYRKAQCSRIETCKDLLERSGAVSNPTPAQAMGYATTYFDGC